MPAKQQSDSKVPLLVIVISWLLLIGGIVSTFFAFFFVVPFLFSGGLGSGLFAIIGLISLVKGIGWIILSFGIRKMRRWALNVFLVLTIISVAAFAYSYVNDPIKQQKDYIEIVFNVLSAVYLWSLSKRFK